MTENAAKPLTFAEKIAKSSQILTCRYHAADKKLFVTFKGSPANLYTYTPFPPELWAAMQRADSLGSFMARHVKGRFVCVKSVIDKDGMAAEIVGTLDQEFETDGEQPAGHA